MTLRLAPSFGSLKKCQKLKDLPICQNKKSLESERALAKRRPRERKFIYVCFCIFLFFLLLFVFNPFSFLLHCRCIETRAKKLLEGLPRSCQSRLMVGRWKISICHFAKQLDSLPALCQSQMVDEKWQISR